MSDVTETVAQLQTQFELPSHLHARAEQEGREVSILRD